MDARSRRRLGIAVVAVGVGLVAAAFLVSKRLQLEVADRVRALTGEPPTEWASAPPEELGFDPEALRALRDALPAQHTRGLLVARRGKIALEWYRPGAITTDRFPTAALAKGAVATPLALAAASDGWLALDAPVSRYLPSWADDPLRSQARVWHLLAHAAGVENVPFPTAQAIAEGGRSGEGFPDWQEEYYARPAERFRFAAERAPILHRPGTRYDYSGVGFYALALALARAGRDAGVTDLGAWYGERLLEPLGIPRRAWTLSYGTHYEREGLRLYALGSGARFSVRALARVGELFRRGGRWEGRALLEPALVERALSNAGLPPPSDPDGVPQPSIGLGWWVNEPRYFASLPPDAAVAAGSKHQVLLVVPSLELVVVRVGWELGEATWEGDYWRDLERELLVPLVRSLEASGGGAAAEAGSSEGEATWRADAATGS